MRNYNTSLKQPLLASLNWLHLQMGQLKKHKHVPYKQNRHQYNLKIE